MSPPLPLSTSPPLLLGLGPSLPPLMMDPPLPLAPGLPLSTSPLLLQELSRIYKELSNPDFVQKSNADNLGTLLDLPQNEHGDPSELLLNLLQRLEVEASSDSHLSFCTGQTIQEVASIDYEYRKPSITQVFKVLSLYVPARGRTSLDACLKLYFGLECHESEEDRVLCEACNDQVRFRPNFGSIILWILYLFNRTAIITSCRKWMRP